MSACLRFAWRAASSDCLGARTASLTSNEIGHAGAMAIKAALEKGCCPKLKELL